MKCSAVIDWGRKDYSGHPCEDKAFAQCSHCERGFCSNHNILDKCEKESCGEYVCMDCYRKSNPESKRFFDKILCYLCYEKWKQRLEHLDEGDDRDEWDKCFQEFNEWIEE